MIAAGGLLPLALWLEDLIAKTHGMSVLDVHEHTAAPLASHGIAILSIVLSCWPRWKEIQASLPKTSSRWQAVGIAVIVVFVLFGEIMIAAVAAFVSSLAVSVVSRAQHRKLSSGSQR